MPKTRNKQHLAREVTPEVSLVRSSGLANAEKELQVSPQRAQGRPAVICLTLVLHTILGWIRVEMIG